MCDNIYSSIQNSKKVMSLFYLVNGFLWPQQNPQRPHDLSDDQQIFNFLFM